VTQISDGTSWMNEWTNQMKGQHKTMPLKSRETGNIKLIIINIKSNLKLSVFFHRRTALSVRENIRARQYSQLADSNLKFFGSKFSLMIWANDSNLKKFNFSFFIDAQLCVQGKNIWCARWARVNFSRITNYRIYYYLFQKNPPKTSEILKSRNKALKRS
jgi:hypothetical protein